jgi:hypothetical protein
VTGEGAFHPVDLADVHAEADDVHAGRVAGGPGGGRGYSTVTLFARFRGRSTSQPRARAAW